MSDLASELSNLHEIHLKLHDVRQQLERGPRQIAARRKKVQAAEHELLEQEEALKQARAGADRKSLDLRSKETQLEELQAKLNAASSNREYDIIRGQIDADKVAMSVLEDEILELLDRVDSAQRGVGEIKEKVKQAEDEVSAFADDFEKKAEGLRRREEGLLAQLGEAEKVIPLQIRDQYRRLVEAHGADAMAAVEDGVCSCCNVTLTTQMRVSINSGNFNFCTSCGRLLYRPRATD